MYPTGIYFCLYTGTFRPQYILGTWTLIGTLEGILKGTLYRSTWSLGHAIERVNFGRGGGGGALGFCQGFQTVRCLFLLGLTRGLHAFATMQHTICCARALQQTLPAV